MRLTFTINRFFIINISQLHQQAQSALNQGLYQQAHQYLLKILQADKYFADAYFLLAMIASAHHNMSKAIELISQALALSPNNAEYLAQLAKHFALENDHIQAVKFAEQAAQQTPSSALTLDTIGVAYSQIGLHQLAVPFFQQAVQKNATNPAFFFNLGASLKFIGDFDAARAAYEQTLLLAPFDCKTHAAISSLGGITAQHNHIARLLVVQKNISHADDILYIGHALAKEYEALAQYEQAFTALSSAKAAKVSKLAYNIADDKKMFASLHHCFSRLHAQPLSAGYHTDEALFVVGMPRTGTTLVERILSQHTQVTSVGELQHFGLLFKKMAKTASNRVLDAETITAAHTIDFAQLGKAYIESTRAISGKTAKFVDKMPLNVLYAGFIIQALPQAKIICLDRAPLDTIVSNFRQLFAVNFSYYNYAYQLTTAAEFYLLFKALIGYWQKTFPDNFYVVNYEKLVNEPDIEAKKMVQFAGLTWQDDCLQIDKNTAPVATASAVQVRQPISNKSIGNWKKYEAYLDEVKAILAR